MITDTPTVTAVARDYRQMYRNLAVEAQKWTQAGGSPFVCAWSGGGVDHGASERQ